MKVFLLIPFFGVYVQGDTFSVESKQGSVRKNLINETFSKSMDLYTTLSQPQKRPCAFEDLEKSMEKFLILENYIKFNRKCFKSVKSFHFLRFLSRQKCWTEYKDFLIWLFFLFINTYSWVFVLKLWFPDFQEASLCWILLAFPSKYWYGLDQNGD